MTTVVFFGFAVLTAAPLVVWAVICFRRWQHHYGDGSTIWGYIFRMYSGKLATEDSVPLKLVWVIYAVGWMGFVTSVII